MLSQYATWGRRADSDLILSTIPRSHGHMDVPASSLRSVTFEKSSQITKQVTKASTGYTLQKADYTVHVLF